MLHWCSSDFLNENQTLFHPTIPAEGWQCSCSNGFKAILIFSPLGPVSLPGLPDGGGLGGGIRWAVARDHSCECLSRSAWAEGLGLCHPDSRRHHALCLDPSCLMLLFLQPLSWIWAWLALVQKQILLDIILLKLCESFSGLQSSQKNPGDSPWLCQSLLSCWVSFSSWAPAHPGHLYPHLVLAWLQAFASAVSSTGCLPPSSFWWSKPHPFSKSSAQHHLLLEAAIPPSWDPQPPPSDSGPSACLPRAGVATKLPGKSFGVRGDLLPPNRVAAKSGYWW